jgi:hypothetical protein
MQEISLLAEFLETAERGIMPGRAQLKEATSEDDSSS